MRQSRETNLFATRLGNGRSRQGDPSIKAQASIPVVSLFSFGPHRRDCECVTSDYYGERADFHYIACLQILLRKQVVAVTKLWSLPPEFEAISRDIWSLALTLKGEIPHMDSGNEEHERDERAPGPASNDEDDSQGNTSDSEGSETESGDAGVIDLLVRLSEDDDSDAGQSPNEPQPLMRVRARGLVSKFPCYINLSVLLISCWILRLPVIYSDILKWVSRKVMNSGVCSRSCIKSNRSISSAIHGPDC